LITIGPLGTNGTRDKTTTAGRAHIVKDCLYAMRTIGALIGTNPGVR